MSRGKKLVIVLIAAVIGAPLLFFAGSLAYISLRYSGTGIYEANWGVTVPRGLTELYSDDGTGGLQGDGPRYTVYSCGDVAGLGVELSPGVDAAFRSGFDMVTDELGVPEGYRPDFGAACDCAVVTDHDYERNNLYIVWDGKALYLAEWIM